MVRESVPATKKEILGRESPGTSALLQHYLARLNGLGRPLNSEAAYDSFFIGLEAYGLPGRSYHNSGHRNDMSLGVYAETLKALKSGVIGAAGEGTLSDRDRETIASAAAFAGFHHDDVYIQVDGGVTPDIAGILRNYVTLGAAPDYAAAIRQDLPPAGKLVCDIFGFAPGETIALNPPRGLNEFLSALVAAHCAEHVIGLDADTKPMIAGAVAVIEATVPFRSSDAFEKLYTRLTQAGLEAGMAEIYTKTAVLTANRDVDGFCGGPIDVETSLKERFQRFAHGTWNLMPEANGAFRGRDYTPAQFLMALRGNLGFLTQAPVTAPDRVFHQFRDYPSDENLRIMRERWGKEIRPLAEDYLKAKIASMSIVAALAARHQPDGENVPLAKFVNGIDPYLPKNGECIFGDQRYRVIYDTLVDRGQDAPHGWDTRGSPIATHLLEAVGKAGIDGIFRLQDINLKSGAMNYAAFLGDVNRTQPEALRGIMEALINSNEVIAREASEASRGADQRKGGLLALRLDLA